MSRVLLFLMAGLGPTIALAGWEFDSTIEPSFDDDTGTYTFDEE